jgi:D-alanyl-D-alanine carboxypeptidase
MADQSDRWWTNHAGGRLLPARLLAGMQSTVDAGDGSRYGLGLRWTPLPCGGGYWTHGGNGVGYTTFAGATSAGRAVSVAVFSRTFDPVEAERQDRAMRALIGNALCHD